MRYYLILIIYIFTSCASQSSPKGGSIDIKGPLLLKATPNNNTKISNSDKIILYFDEDINSISAVKALSISNFNNFEYKVQGKKIIISPIDKWPNIDFIKINISRELSDLRNNIISESIHLFYSFLKKLPNKQISGNIINSNDNIFEVVLFKIENKKYSFIDKTQSDINGDFNFLHLNKGKYIIFSVQDFFEDVSQDIKNRSYGFISDEFIDLDTLSDSNVKIMIEKPLQELSIQSFRQINNNFGLFMLSNGSEYPFFIKDISYNSFIKNDTVSVSLDLENRMSSYSTQNYKLVLNNILDSIPPNVEFNDFIGNDYYLKFSEPILGFNILDINKLNDSILNYRPSIFTYSQDSSVVNLEYNFKNYLELKLNLSEYNSDNIYVTNMYDYFGNQNSDTLKISISDSKNINNIKKDFVGGNIYGSIDYMGRYPVMVKAENINEDNIYYDLLHKNNNFQFINIKPGFYNFIAYEILGDYDSTEYFNGSWSPYKRAAGFGVYHTTLEVRSLWDIQDMIIPIK
jgi:hypothetical protein